MQIRLSRLNTILQENLAGIKVVKAFVREPEQQQRFAASADDLMAQQIQVARTFSFLFPMIFLIMNLGQAAVLYFGGGQIIQDTLTLGEWQKFSLYLIYVFFPLGQLGMIINQMSQASASAVRIFEILDAKSDVTDKPGAQVLSEVEGRIEFDHVTFRYFGGGEPVLKDVSFAAEPGQTVALLGATGSGKTTIINLIPRFYDVTSGTVCIDGHDVRDVTLDSLRAQIGIVLQDTTLFTGTIRDNIAFGRPDASMDEVIAAARAAAAHDFIMSFPQAYDTPVGERGTTLSGGQKQRVAIARALLHGPAHPDPGRLDQQRGRGHRVPDPAGADPADEGPHELRHRPAHQHRAQRRPDPRAGQGPDRGPGQARRTDGEQPDLRRDLLVATGRRRARRDGRCPAGDAG